MKIVDRMEFSYANFSPDILKGWDKREGIKMAKPLSFKDMINAEPRPGEDELLIIKCKKRKERILATKTLNPKKDLHYPYNNA